MTSTCIVAIVEKVSYEVSHDLHSVATAIVMLLEYLKNLRDMHICYAYLLHSGNTSSHLCKRCYFILQVVMGGLTSHSILLHSCF